MKLLILCALVGYAFGMCNETKLEACDDMFDKNLKPEPLMSNWPNYDFDMPDEFEETNDGMSRDRIARNVPNEDDLLAVQLGPLDQNVTGAPAGAGANVTVAVAMPAGNMTYMQTTDTTPEKDTEEATAPDSMGKKRSSTTTVRNGKAPVGGTTAKKMPYKKIECKNEWMKYYQCMEAGMVKMCADDKKHKDKASIKKNREHYDAYLKACPPKGGGGGGATLKPLLFVTLTTMTFCFL